jgi:hypothetical protein
MKMKSDKSGFITMRCFTSGKEISVFDPVNRTDAYLSRRFFVERHLENGKERVKYEAHFEGD